MTPSDILSKLGFSEGLGSVGDGETWETKTPAGNPSPPPRSALSDPPCPVVDEKKPQEDSEMDPARLMDMLGLSAGEEAAAGEEAWEKKTNSSTADLI
jgi:hypothetical protein